MIIFKSLLTTFEASVILWGSWGMSKNWLKPKNQTTITNVIMIVISNIDSDNIKYHLAWDVTNEVTGQFESLNDVFGCVNLKKEKKSQWIEKKNFCWPSFTLPYV